MMNVEYQISGSAFDCCPIEMAYGLIYTEDDVLEIPQRHPFMSGWGRPESYCITENATRSFPMGLEIGYLSICEQQMYEAMIEFPDNLFELMWTQEMQYIIFGMAPKGKIAIWVSGEKRSILVCAIEAEMTGADMSVFSPNEPDISVQEYCRQYRSQLDRGQKCDLDIFEMCLKQYNYRYHIIFNESKTDKDNKTVKIKNEFDWIEDSLSDGTYDKLHDGRLNTYHNGGVPVKCNIALHKGNIVWLVSLWFDVESLERVFHKICGAHPETKTDFIIRIDAENKKYELALYRQGLKEPVVIPESAYQLIVFKNKFEDYRSENYNQLRGAWIW